MKAKFSLILLLCLTYTSSLVAQEEYVVILDKNGTIEFNYLKENISKYIGSSNSVEVEEMRAYLTQDWQFETVNSPTFKSAIIRAKEDKAELLFFSPNALLLRERLDQLSAYIGIGNIGTNTEVEGEEVLSISIGKDAKDFGFQFFEGFSIQLATAQNTGPSTVQVELIENDIVLYSVDVKINSSNQSSLNYFENTMKLRNLHFDTIRMTPKEGSFYLGTGLESLNTRFYLIKE